MRLKLALGSLPKERRFSCIKFCQLDGHYLFQVSPIPHILQPLFPISSWSQDDLARDQRLQLETELRERGLLANEYAVSQVLAAPPPSVHRPDQRSTIGLGTKTN